MQRLVALLRLSRPLYLLLAALTYFLGAGVARYLGRLQLASAFWLGLLGVLFAQLAMSLLGEVFRPANEPIVPAETLADRKAIRDAALYVSIAALTSLGVVVFLLFKDHQMAPAALVVCGIALLGILAGNVPPLRLGDKGFGEFLLAINLAFLSPSIAFLLQARDFHPLLNTVTVPLVFLALAALLALDFPYYAGDLKYERRSLLARLGWERAIPLHHGLVLAAYVLFATAPLLGFSLALIWPAFLTLPFGLLQIYWLRNISLGAKPIWTLLSANAILLFGLTAYFLALTFWLR